jgi:hypothetical protein
MTPLRLNISYESLQGLFDNSAGSAIGGVLMQFIHWPRIQIKTLTWVREPGRVTFGSSLTEEELLVLDKAA